MIFKKKFGHLTIGAKKSIASFLSANHIPVLNTKWMSNDDIMFIKLQRVDNWPVLWYVGCYLHLLSSWIYRV